ncbi:MAG: HAD-IA family hydrolase [Flavobacteriales bacterium]
MHNIKNIILDLGGVLINLDYNKLNDRIGILGLSNAFSKSEQIELFDKLEEGKISEKDFIRAFNRLAEANHNRQTIIDAWNSILLDFPIERLELLKHLGQKYRLFLFSNTNSIHIQEVYNIINRAYGIKNLNHYFEKIYLSNELGIRKPKTDGFDYILKDNNLKRNETLFIDDSPQHVEGAKKAGLNAQWLDLKKEDIILLINRLSLI